MYEPAPDAAELAALGFTLEDVASSPPVDVWEENWVPTQIFAAMSTQWRTTQGAVVGLDYGVLPFVFRCAGIKKRRKQADTLECLQIMESEALKIMNRRDP
jgi:hypothetical protein